jgi:hypothetical protein
MMQKLNGIRSTDSDYLVTAECYEPTQMPTVDQLRLLWSPSGGALRQS